MGLIGLYWVVPGFPRDSRVFLGLLGFWLGSVEYRSVFLCFPRFRWVLLSFTGGGLIYFGFH